MTFEKENSGKYEYYLSLTDPEGKPLSSVVIHPVLMCCGNYESWCPVVTKRDRYAQLKAISRSMRVPPALRINQSSIDSSLTDIKIEQCRVHSSVDECIKHDTLAFCLNNQKALEDEDGKLRHPHIRKTFKTRVLKIITARYRNPEVPQTLAEREFEYEFGVRISNTESDCQRAYAHANKVIKDQKALIVASEEYQQKLKDHECEALTFADGEEQILGNKLLEDILDKLLVDKNLFRCFVDKKNNLILPKKPDGDIKKVLKKTPSIRSPSKSKSKSDKEEPTVVDSSQPEN